MDEAIPPKSLIGRPKGTGTSKGKLLRVLITPRQERLLEALKASWGLSESELVRRGIDDFLSALLRSGDLVDPGPTPPASLEEEKPVHEE